MDESAKKGVELNGSDGEEIRKSSIIRRISVEGYDTSLRLEDVDEALRKHFASCGKIIHVSIYRNLEETILCKYAFVYFKEEEEEEKALRLDGSDMGGQILQIRSYPFHETYLNAVLEPMKDPKIIRHQHTAKVTGYDNSLPLDVVKKQIQEYFSTHGVFVYHTRTSFGPTIIESGIYLRGHDAVDKALERSGRPVGGLNLVITKVLPIPKNPSPTGYVLPRILDSLTKEQRDDPNLYFLIEGNQNKKKKKKNSKTKEGNQKKNKSKTKEGNQKKKSKTNEGNQKKKVV